MVHTTSLLVAAVIFIIVIVISLMLMSGAVPAVDQVVEMFRKFIAGK